MDLNQGESQGDDSANSSSLGGETHSLEAQMTACESLMPPTSALDEDYNVFSINSTTTSTEAAQAQAAPSTQSHIPHPNSFEAPVNISPGMHYYIVYVGINNTRFRYEEVENKVLGVSGHRATKHQTFSQALVEYTWAFYGQKPGYGLHIVSDIPVVSNSRTQTS
ncbi:hypothetical protein Moror_5397 [Moniliophthora roreri MCA 2997]|uniref:Uncharacterized protein n=1 Tax=Moniliophthora roreri (strain MCA 2997) TaxID=1381753 RepID=V2XUF3_MONRO|nr:hypothetical protein Moror_5397 [Moniliophthora roreri MCA 2997]